MDFETITTLSIFHFFLIFSRIGAAMMIFPGIGEVYVTPYARLIFSLALAFILTPILGTHFPPVPSDPITMSVMVFSEIFIGIFIGAMARMLQAILHIAGMIMAFQSSLASALLFDATQGSQGSVVGNLMTIIGITMIFATNLDHLMIQGVSESYNVFAVGTMPPVNNFAEFSSNTISNGFMVAVKISSPLIIVGLLIYLGAGIMSRLMPNMQVFFVMIPLQIYVSFVILSVTMIAGISLYLSHFKEVMSQIFMPM